MKQLLFILLAMTAIALPANAIGEWNVYYEESENSKRVARIYERNGPNSFVITRLIFFGEHLDEEMVLAQCGHDLIYDSKKGDREKINGNWINTKTNKSASPGTQNLYDLACR